MWKLVLVAVVLVGSSGCYHAVLRAGPRANMAPESRTAFNVGWGIADANFDLTDCPSGVSVARVYEPWWSFFPELFTLGILSAKSIEYVCAPLPQPQQYQPPQQQISRQPQALTQPQPMSYHGDEQ